MFSSVLIAPASLRADVFSETAIARFRESSRLREPFIDPSQLNAHADQLAEAEIILSTWGMPRLDERFFRLAPRTQAIFYAAGSVKGFVTEEMWKRQITLCSAWRSNAIPVSEFSLAAILFSLKQVWSYQRRMQSPSRDRERIPTTGAYHSTVGLVSLGAIGWRVVELLRPFEVSIMAYDPFADPDRAAAAGIRLASLEEVFAEADVVSLHTPWLKETENLIHAGLLRRMKPHTTLINTARGAVINEADLVAVMRERPDLTALLDVTHPEPPVADSPLYDLPNIILTPHIAGSVSAECRRMGDSMVDEYLRFTRNEPLQHQVTPEILPRMA